MDWSWCGSGDLVAANDVAVGLVVAGDLVDDVADELDEVDEAGEKELDGVCVGVHGVRWE